MAVRKTISLFIILGIVFGMARVDASDVRPPKPGNLSHFFTGNPVRPVELQPLGGPGILLMGGGSEVDSAFIELARPIVNGGDVVVLRTGNSSGYQSYLNTALRPNSVETLVVNTRAKAETEYVEWVVSGANLIWIAGGDQSEYINLWSGTALARAIERAYARGAVVGGTSAGAQVLGEFIYHPGNQTAVISAEAIANPYRNSMIIADRFVDLPLMHNTLVDVHFWQRRRMGRQLAMMARLRQDERTSEIIGIALDERAALFIDSDGVGHVRRSGQNMAFVFRESRLNTIRERVEPGQSLIYRDVFITPLVHNDTFDFRDFSSSQLTNLVSVNGADLPDSAYDPNP
ncbi:MAG: cyanophycinase [Verrucomicrobia bacterium]|nr:cyanophycinase [Verrucomicrobiota bacterium]